MLVVSDLAPFAKRYALLRMVQVLAAHRAAKTCSLRKVQDLSSDKAGEGDFRVRISGKATHCHTLPGAMSWLNFRLMLWLAVSTSALKH